MRPYYLICVVLFLFLTNGFTHTVYAQSPDYKLFQDFTKICKSPHTKTLMLSHHVGEKYLVEWEKVNGAIAYNLSIIDKYTSEELYIKKKINKTSTYALLPNINTTYAIVLQSVCECKKVSDFSTVYYTIDKNAQDNIEVIFSEVDNSEWEEDLDDSLDTEGKDEDEPANTAPTTMEADLDSEIDRDQQGDGVAVQVDLTIETTQVNSTRDDKFVDDKDTNLTGSITAWSNTEINTTPSTIINEVNVIADRLEQLKEHTELEDNLNNVYLSSHEMAVIDQLQLSNYPNPFYNATTFVISLNQTANVSLTLHNLEGKLVMNLIDQQMMTMGVYKLSFDAMQQLPQGMYLAVLNVGDTRKLLKLQKN